MPLWGISLSKRVARDYGARFLLELDGPFRGIAAWLESGEEQADREIITGVKDQRNSPKLITEIPYPPATAALS